MKDDLDSWASKVATGKHAKRRALDRSPECVAELERIVKKWAEGVYNVTWEAITERLEEKYGLGLSISTYHLYARSTWRPDYEKIAGRTGRLGLKHRRENGNVKPTGKARSR